MDPNANAGATPAPATPQTTETPALPFGQLELATLAETAAKAWDKSALPALLWCPKAQLGQMAAAYKASFDTADKAGDELSPTAQRLRELDEELNPNTRFVRNYLAEAYGVEGAKAYYDEFGLKKRGGLPTARPARAQALNKLTAALKTHKFDQNKYGSAYWEPLAAEYAKLAGQSSAGRQEASGEAGTKNVQEKPLRKVLRALRLSIRANFPDTYEAELRRFGFLAESF